MGTNDMNDALLLIAHGSRNAEANDDLHFIAAEIERGKVYSIAEPAFLELAEPTIDVAARRCVERGAGTIVLIPYFLSAGVHVRRDLQAWREKLAREFLDVRVLLAEPIGRHPLMEAIVLERAGEALTSKLLGK